MPNDDIYADVWPDLWGAANVTREDLNPRLRDQKLKLDRLLRAAGEGVPGLPSPAVVNVPGRTEADGAYRLEVEPDRELSVLGSETLVGLAIGTICGLATFAATALWKDPNLGLAIGVAITCAVTWAAFLGCAVPMVCRRIGIDPAIIAGPFLITVSDISGTSLYLGVALLLTA